MKTRMAAVLLWICAAPAGAQEVASFDGTFESVAFSGDGKTVVSGGKDGTVRVWPVK